MENIEYYKFLESLSRAGISSFNQMQNLLLKCFPELLAEEVNYVLNNFHNNHDEIVKNIKIPHNENWETAWNNVEVNSFILSSPLFENFDSEVISSTFNLTKEETSRAMTSCFENFQTNYAAIVLNNQLMQCDNIDEFSCT